MNKNLIIAIVIALVAGAYYMQQKKAENTAEITLPGGASIEITKPE
jgi:hypothetical protein